MSAVPTGPRRQLSLDQASERLPALVQDVALHGPVELTEGGKAVAILVGPDDFRRLAGDRPGFWEALQKFRADVDLEELDIDSVLKDVRDRSPGRDVEL
jgi:antitoxin (DNA-binding transcriptional repressor) of toxin-antitoxin stability system